MNIQYSKKKRELRRDPVLETLNAAKQFVIHNGTYLVGGVVVAALLVAGFLSYLSMERRGVERARIAYGNAVMAYRSGNVQEAIDALAVVAENHEGTPQASYSALLLGNILHRQRRFDEALAWFEKAREESSGDTFIRGGALEGMAACYEGKGDYERAVELLEQARAEKWYAYRHPALRWKMALLLREIGEEERAARLCTELKQDTTAVEYHDEADVLLTEMSVADRGS